MKTVFRYVGEYIRKVCAMKVEGISTLGFGCYPMAPSALGLVEFLPIVKRCSHAQKCCVNDYLKETKIVQESFSFCSGFASVQPFHSYWSLPNRLITLCGMFRCKVQLLSGDFHSYHHVATNLNFLLPCPTRQILIRAWYLLFSD